MSAIIFDFDGTLADTQSGILATSQETLRGMGRKPADEAALAATIGLPLRENFTRGAGLDEEEADRAVAIYRAIFDETAVPLISSFPGVEETLRTLSERGILTVTPECVTIFTPSATGHFRYQIAGDSAWSSTMLEKIRTFNKIH